MKTPALFKTLLLVLLLAAVEGALFYSCEKPDEPTQEQPQTPSASITTSDVDIQGTWESVFPVWPEGYGLYITFPQNTCEVETLYPNGSFFQNGDQGNYLVHNNSFYMWHVTPYPNFIVTPFPQDLPPMFRFEMAGDTMKLHYLYGPLFQGAGFYPTRYELIKTL